MPPLRILFDNFQQLVTRLFGLTELFVEFSQRKADRIAAALVLNDLQRLVEDLDHPFGFAVFHVQILKTVLRQADGIGGVFDDVDEVGEKIDPALHDLQVLKLVLLLSQCRGRTRVQGGRAEQAGGQDDYGYTFS